MPELAIAVCLLLPCDAPFRPGEPMPLVLPEACRAELAPVQSRVYRMAMQHARGLLRTVERWTAEPSLLLLTESKSTEHYIRPNTGMVEGLAFLCRFGPYDKSVVGQTRADLLKKVLTPMLRYLVVTHVTGSRKTSDGKPWGDAWQSAHWAQAMGRGAWWVWSDLPEDLRAGVVRVVAHEADRFADAVPPHRIQQDTKAEENAWNSQILSVAVVLMPDDPRRPGWERAFQRWAFSALLRPADERSPARVDGRSVAEQYTGANLYNDFTLENHGFVHPDYMTCFSLSLGCALDYTLTGRRPPEALLHNVAGVYENLKWFSLPDGGFVYPSGQDWALFRNPAWTYAHLLMAVYGGDGDAWSLSLRGLATAEKMQAGSSQGTVFRAGEYFFASTQHDAFRKMAHEWLLLQTAGAIDDRPQPKLGVRRLDAGKLILRRTPQAIHTVSWGARIMAQCVPYRLDRIVSPDMRNGIGEVRVKGKSRPLPVTVRSADVTDGADTFRVRLVVDHGEHVRAHLEYVSEADGAWIMRERLEMLEEGALEQIQTGLIGILNNPAWVYERGRRTLSMDGQSQTVPAQSGKQWEGQARRIEIDSILQIESERAMNFVYAAAKAADRGRATDRLYLNAVAVPEAWQTGQTLSECEVRVRCRP